MGLRPLLFIVLSLAALIPVVFFGVWPHSQAFENELSDVTDRHLLLARNMGAALQRYDRDVKTTFRTLTQNIVRGTPLVGTQKMLSNLDFRHICVATIENGTIVNSLNEEVAQCPKRVPPKRFTVFKEIASKDEVKFTEVLQGPHGKPLLYIVLIIDDLISVGAIKTDYIVELGKSTSFGKRGHAAIIDHKGRVLAHPLPKWRQTMKDLSALEPVKRMLNRETGVSMFYSPALKDDMIAGFTWVPGPNWGVMIPQPVAELRARADSVQRYALVVIITGVLAAAILSWFLSGYLTRPVHAVVDAARKMSAGGRTVRVPSISKAAPRELKTLRETFNIMANANEEAHQKLTAIAEAVSSETGENVFEHLVNSLAQILKIDFAYIGELTTSGGSLIRTVAFHHDGVIADNFDYSLIGAPCENVVGKETCVYGSDVQQVFPGNESLKMLGVQCYVGMPLFDPEGSPLGLIVMMNREPLGNLDTAVDLLHIMANRAAAELHRHSLEGRLLQAQKMEAIGQLTGGIAHEFNNLLMVIVGNLERSMKSDSDSAARKFTSSAIDGAIRGSELTRQLLAFSRKQDLRAEPVDLNVLVRDMRDMLQRTLGETVFVDTELADGIWSILADKSLLESSLLNLSLNARDAMPNGGKIVIVTSNRSISARDLSDHPNLSAGDYVMLEVADSGTGIAPAILEHVFEPFFTTKDVGKGTGLGLSMILGFAEQSGGFVDIESEPGLGTKVRICLPRTMDAAVALETEKTMDTEVPSVSATVLVVEDDPDVRQIVVGILSELGCMIVEAEDGKTAISALAKNREIDVLFTDVVLPGGLSGPDIAGEACNMIPELKIVFTSGYPDGEVNDFGSDGEKPWFIRKPYRKTELAELFDRVLQS
jgi:signal transduction histidine kinase/CheY-like chemotaxis protein/HAMP domain-containing protein